MERSRQASRPGCLRRWLSTAQGVLEGHPLKEGDLHLSAGKRLSRWHWKNMARC
jgi:hypothetical protein